MKEIVEQRNERQYLIKHLLEILAIIFVLIRGYLGIFTYVFNCRLFQYYLLDPLICFVYVNNTKGFVFFTIIVLMPLIHGLMASYAFFFQSVKCISNHLCYDLIVLNIDQLKHCQISKREQKALLKIEFQINLNRLKRNFIWNIVPIRFILRQICWQWTKYQLYFNMKMQKSSIFKYRLKLIPNHPIEVRQKLANVVHLFDWMFYIWHWIIGNDYFIF